MATSSSSPAASRDKEPTGHVKAVEQAVHVVAIVVPFPLPKKVVEKRIQWSVEEREINWLPALGNERDSSFSLSSVGPIHLRPVHHPSYAIYNVKRNGPPVFAPSPTQPTRPTPSGRPSPSRDMISHIDRILPAHSRRRGSRGRREEKKARKGAAHSALR